MTAAGDLRQRLVLYRPLSAPDDAGGRAITVEMAGQVWAAVSLRLRNPQVDADQLMPAETYRVILRYRTDIESGWQFGYEGRRLAVRSAGDLDGRKIWLECLCEEAAP